jgi:hypothetical protein
MEASGEGGQLVEALGEAEPGRAAVREQEAGPVGELEAGSRRDTRMIGSYRQTGEQEAERLMAPNIRPTAAEARTWRCSGASWPKAK